MSSRPLGGILLLGALTVLWGGNWPAMKLALRELDPWTFRTVCLLVGGAGLLALARAGGQSLRVPHRERWPLAVVAFFNITVWHLCSAYGLARIQAGRGVIIAYTMPLWTVVIGRLVVGERITRPRLAALGLGLGGLITLVAPAARALWDTPAGALLMLAAAVAWAFGTVLTKSATWTVPTAILTGWQVLLGGVPIALGAALRLLAATGADSRSEPTSLSSAALLGTAYATLVGVIFCHWAWFRLVAILPPGVAAIGILGIPIVGLFTSGLILGEPVGLAELVALVLVVSGLGILVVELSGGPRESAHGGRAGATTGREPR